MAVLLVLASGTAVSLAVTDSGDSDAGANVQGETTTEVVETTDDAAVETTEAVDEETTEAVDEETTAAADDGEDAAATQPATVSINEQESDGEQVVIDSVTMEEGGFVAIHDQSALEEGDAVGSVLGNSVYLEAGTHENVTITLGQPIDETQTLVAMPHLDTNDNQVYDFVISAGEVDGPYTADGEAVTDQATVNVDGAAETEEPAETTEEDVVETEEPAETTEEDVVETEEPAETTEEDVVETEEPAETTEEDVVETEEPAETTEAVDETTEVVDETTAAPEEPAGDQQQFVFKIEQMSIDRWSFVVGDEETPDRTESVSDITVTDRRVEINLTEMLQQQAEMGQQYTTQDPEQAQEQLEENLSGDLETVRFVIEDVNVENVTLVVTAPADMELPEQPGMGPQMTTEEDDVVVETTEPEDAAEETTEEDVVETEEPAETTEAVDETTEEDVVETTEEDVVEETTEEDAAEETTEEDVVETTEEDVVETEEPAETTEAVDETTEEEDVVEETTTAEPALDSLNVSSIDAPDSASAGDTVTVSAQVTNPNEVEATQQVELRLDGDVVERQSVSVAGNDQQTVTFELDTSNLSSGDYVHGVFTRDFGEVAVLTVDEPTAEGDETEVVEETTEVVGTETPDAEATTEAAGIETTVVANETTVEG